MFGLEAIFRNGVPIGHLRRSDYGFFIDKTIGYGYIRNPDGGVVKILQHTSLTYTNTTLGPKNRQGRLLCDLCFCIQE